LAKGPDFIKTGFHIGRFITTVVNTKAERADIEALKSNLYSTSTRINVSSFIFHFIPLKRTPDDLHNLLEGLTVSLLQVV
jgi:hypothetical protein